MSEHSGHKIVKCSECDKVIMQCRCIDKNKPTEYRICEDCFEKIGRGAVKSFDEIVGELMESNHRIWENLTGGE